MCSVLKIRVPFRGTLHKRGRLIKRTPKRAIFQRSDHISVARQLKLSRANVGLEGRGLGRFDGLLGGLGLRV